MQYTSCLHENVSEKSDRKDKRKRNFTEGWVEFLDKRVAKQVVVALNGQTIKGIKMTVLF